MARRDNPITLRVSAELPSRASLLIAVSGGVDSVCLLHVCSKLKRAKRLRLGVAHLDHGLRETSAQDLKRVEELCASLDIPLFSSSVSPPTPALNLERWGRDERYRFFTRLMEEEEFDFTLTAHTADDVAETFLMRLISGRPLRSIVAHDFGRRLIRPFLNVQKTELLKYAQLHDLAYVEDESNQDLRFLRNKLRCKLLPFMEAHFEGRTKRILCAQARRIDEDVMALESLASELSTKIGPIQEHSREWLERARGEFRATPFAISWRASERILFPTVGYLVGREKAGELIEVICSSRLGMEISGGPTISRKSSGIAIDFKKRESNTTASNNVLLDSVS